MTKDNILDCYQNNEDFKHFVDHWAEKHNVPVEEVLTYEITRLYAESIKERRNNNEEIHYEIRQDNGI